MAGAGGEARAARLQQLDGLLEMPRPEEFDQVPPPPHVHRSRKPHSDNWTQA